MRTSDLLKQGSIYTRNQLKDRFNINDATINNGIFKPPSHDSIWLFVTEEKSSDMTQFDDHLEGDTLHWQGQLSGVRDSMIIDHVKNGLEVVVFYRPHRKAYDDYGFRFEGPFEYHGHSGSQPTNFTLRRAKQMTQPTKHTAECLVDALAQLRQAGVDAVVAEGGLTPAQQKMHVADRIEVWVADRIIEWRRNSARKPILIVLSGNAGDGKSQLIERLRSRHEAIKDDTDVVSDATHAETPSQSQAQRLVDKFALFADDENRPKPAPRCVLVAINVGMVIAFFAALSDEDRGRFTKLRGVLEYRLGLNPAPTEPPEHWNCEVINLDHRNVLGDYTDSFFEGMLAKLDPEDTESITYEAAQACTTCQVRTSCWVRTNLNLLRLPAVRLGLHQVLSEASLSTELHLTPRNLWDLLFEITTGGLVLPPELANGQSLSCDWMRDNLPLPEDPYSKETFRLVHRRLLYHLLFERPHTSALTLSPLIVSLESVDPIRVSGKHTHLLEGEVRATPKADANNLSDLASEASELDESAVRQPDPLLNRLASVVTDPVVLDVIGEPNAQDMALGVSRRARLTGYPEEIYAEVANTEFIEFVALLEEYRRWRSGAKTPQRVAQFWTDHLIAGVAKIFGVQVQGVTYFRLDTLSPATRFPAYVEVDLWDKITIIADSVVNGGAEWLSAVAYLPRSLTVVVDTGAAEPWEIPVDFRLFRLLRKVSMGYSASSVDLEAFFRLRYACERLGPTDAKQIIFRALDDGQQWLLSRKKLGTLVTTQFGPVK